MPEALTKAQEPNQAQPTLRFIYRNWRGDIAERRVRPITIWFGKTDWHPQEQWFMAAIDDENGNRRDFAIAEILTFEPTRAAPRPKPKLKPKPSIKAIAYEIALFLGVTPWAVDNGGVEAWERYKPLAERVRSLAKESQDAQ